MTNNRITIRISDKYMEWLPDAILKAAAEKIWSPNKLIQEILVEKLKDYKPKENNSK